MSLGTVRVLLAEDHALVRAGLRSLLAELTWVRVVGEAANGRQAVRMASRHHPDVVLMDITMADLNGLDATERIVRQHPATRVIVLSMHTSEEYVRRALAAGAAGYLPKDSDRHELELALRTVAAGGTFLSPAVAAPDESAEEVRLSPRQREILQLIAEGNSTRAMAIKLDLSAKTIETHRSQLMHRLDIHDVAGLVRYAIRQGVITADP